VKEINDSDVSVLEAAFIAALAIGAAWAAFAGYLVDAGFLFVLTIVNVLLFEYSVNAESYPISEKGVRAGSAIVLACVFFGSLFL
jgi:hypothetical protein